MERTTITIVLFALVVLLLAGCPRATQNGQTPTTKPTDASATTTAEVNVFVD